MAGLPPKQVEALRGAISAASGLHKSVCKLKRAFIQKIMTGALSRAIQLIGFRINHLLTMFRETTARATQAVRGKPEGNWGRTMELTPINTDDVTTSDQASKGLAVARCLAAAADGEISAYFDLGVIFSTGSGGVDCDLIEAHKWFNLAASRGHEEAAWSRADISDEMTAREIAEAQRRARQWMAEERRRAA